MLYSFCIKKGIKTNENDSINDLAAYVKLIFADRGILLDTLVSKLTNINNSGIINILKEIRDYNKTEFLFTDQSSSIIEKNKNLDNPLKRSILTNEEAILYAAKRFNIDISESPFPPKELLELSRNNVFKPQKDTSFYDHYITNPLFYNLTTFWKKRLSMLYTEKMMMNLLNNECVNCNDISNPKQLIYELTLTKNFYPGIIPNLHYNSTFVYNTPFTDINKKYIISYGIINTGDIIGLTPDEITDFFKIHREFKDFKNEGEILSERNVKKLILICKKFPQETDFTTLLQTIKETKEMSNIINSKIREFITYVKNCDQTTRGNINELFEKLFKMAMYMRGWNGEGEYPLTENMIKDFSERYHEIEDRVTDSIKETINCIGRLSDTSKMLIKSLPLIKISDKDKSFYRSTNTDEGLTFYDRLLLLENPNDNVYACMRLSSNHLAVTAQHYNMMLNAKSFFNVSEMDLIS